MPIVLPEMPVEILTLISFFAPYAIAAINHPSWKSGSKRLFAIVFSIVLTLVVIVFHYLMTGDAIQSSPIMILLGLIVSQAVFTATLEISQERRKLTRSHVKQKHPRSTPLRS